MYKYYVQVRNDYKVLFSLGFDTFSEAYNCFEWQRDTAHKSMGGSTVTFLENGQLKSLGYTRKHFEPTAPTPAPYLFNFTSVNDVFYEFRVPTPLQEGVDIVAAHYDIGDYEGEAWVVFIKDGKWYEVHGSHCSCYGLEDQWDPEETFPEAMLRYNKFNSEMKAAIEGRMS